MAFPENMTPIQAIRLKCIDGCCGQKKEADLCENENCPIHRFRHGTNPNYKRKTKKESDS